MNTFKKIIRIIILLLIPLGLVAWVWVPGAWKIEVAGFVSMVLLDSEL